MKVIITESQYKKILLEQSNVYDDDISYQKALKIYDEIWKTYNDSVKYYNFIKNLGDINTMNAETWTDDGFTRLFNSSTKKTTANSLRKKEEIYKNVIPYLKKAVEIDPKDKEISQSLLSVYNALDMTAEYKDLKAKAVY